MVGGDQVAALVKRGEAIAPLGGSLHDDRYGADREHRSRQAIMLQHDIWGVWAQLGQHPVSDLVRTPTSPVVGVGCPHHVTHAQGPRLFADAVIGQTVWRPEQLDLSDPIGSKGVIGATQLPHDLFGPQGKQIGVIPGV